jgi:amino acid adenylation domain-containing protein
MKTETQRTDKQLEVLIRAANKIDELQKEVQKHTGKKEIAVIGYNCRFPGGANDVQAFWERLKKGFDAVSEISVERFSPEVYYDPEKGVPGKMYTKNAALLETDIKEFDNVHFEISAVEAMSIDPQHRLLLEVCWEALENAGVVISRLKGSKTGVFIGAESFEYAGAEFVSDDMETITPYTLFGIMPTSASGRLSYYFDFKGPSITCDTACSSSLTALNMAVDSLRNGQCDLAIVGGVNLILTPNAFVGLSQIQALSADGKCKTFDAAADGFGRGEGCGIVLLKRAEDARRDGCTIEAIIKSIAIGQDGKSNGFFAPNGVSEKGLLRSVLCDGKLSAEDVDYIEAHGTGTLLGDHIEAQAICEVYGERSKPILIGSVKTNIGHLEAAAGIASLIKVLLSLKYKQLPPSIHFHTPNPNINWDKLQVVTRLMDWNSTSGKRRAAINSFGITGALAHVIVEEADLEPDSDVQSVMPCQLFTLSAPNETALRKRLVDFQNYIISTNEKMAYISYSSNISRSHMKYRFAIVSDKRETLIQSIEEALRDKSIFDYHTDVVRSIKYKIAFLFTGQGSIYENIAKEFYETSLIYREAFDQCDSLFSQILGISIKQILFEGNVAQLEAPSYSQPLIFSVEYALTKIWETLDVRPDVVIGHSIGEYAAACYAGLFSLADAVRMIAARGRLMEAIELKGKMVGILTDISSIKRAIEKSGNTQVSIAAVNAPQNITISGEERQVDRVISCLRNDQRVFVNDLRITRPYHSSMMKSYEKQFENELLDVVFLKPDIQMISCMTGNVANEIEMGNVYYWSKHLSKTVDYQAAIWQAQKLGVNIFIEIGGTATLCGLAEQCLQNQSVLYAPTLRNGVFAYKQWLDSIKNLYLHGVSLDWKRFYEKYEKGKIFLPNYSFERKRLWRDVKQGTRQQVIHQALKDEKDGEVYILDEQRGSVPIMSIQLNEQSKYDAVLSELVNIVHMITGLDRAMMEPEKELFAYGFDSLLLASLGKQLSLKFHLEASLDQFFMSLNTLEKIAQYIVGNCEFELDEVQMVSIPEFIENRAGEISLSNESINRSFEITETIRAERSVSSEIALTQTLFENQYAIMQEQNTILKSLLRYDAVPATSMDTGLSKQHGSSGYVAPAKISTVKQKSEINYYVPYKKLDVTNEHFDMKALQLFYIKEIEKKYTGLTKNSKNKTQQYRHVYASNRNSAGFRPVLKEMLYQIIAEKGKGSKILDIDGNELIDITMGFGVNFFGHCPPFVEEALREEIKNGMPLGPMGRLAGEVARKIAEMTGVERVFFCNSGTEANMFAVRIARAVTKKNKIVCFKGSFHGTYDGFLGVPSYSEDGEQSSLALAPGITDNAVKDLVLLDYNKDKSLHYIATYADEIAAVITEPVQSRRPDIQPREFLQKLRTVTAQNQVALIFDEIITGFRIGAGGAQEHFGVQADIVTYGKVIGGGMPIGVVSGKGDYLDSIDGGMWQFGDNSVPPNDDKRTFVAGTFCHHPMAMAATNATLDYIAENKTTLYADINRKTSRFAREMNAFFSEEQIPLHINHFSSLFRFSTTLDQEIFYYGLLAKGIYIWEGRNCFFSTAHTEADIAAVAEAVKQTTREMKQAGYFGGQPDPDPFHPRKKIANSESDTKQTRGIQGENIKADFPMSVIQKRLYSYMLITESDPYDIVAAYTLKEDLPVNTIENVIQTIIQRHEVLRSAMYLDQGEYKQKVQDNFSFQVHELTLCEERELNTLVTKFDIQQPPLLEVLLIHTLNRQQIILFHFHHIAADGMSMNLFVNEFSKLYQKESLPPLKKQYRDFVEWEKLYLMSVQYQQDREYWLNTLADMTQVPSLFYDKPMPLNSSYPGNTVVDRIDDQILSALKKIAMQNSVSLFMVLLSALNVLLHKVAFSNEISILTPVTNRFNGGFEECIGMFTNTIVVKNFIYPDEAFIALLKRIKKNILSSYLHSNYPYNQIIQELNLIGHSTFGMEFVYEKVDERDANQTGLALESLDFVPHTQEGEITFELLEKNGYIDMFFRYRTDLFEKESIEHLLKRFRLILSQIVDNPEIDIAKIQLIRKEERIQILEEFNITETPYPKDRTIVDLLVEQAKQHPYRTAVVYDEQELSYGDLLQKANKIAYRLRGIGVESNDRVAVIAPKSIEAIVGICGILLAGGAYVPIDESYPKERIDYILKDCNPKALLYYQITVETEFPVLDLAEEILWEKVDEELEYVGEADQLAYVIYTSGTTGRPKGVMVENKSVIRLVRNINYANLNADTVILQTGAISFDASTFEIWGALLNGGKLVLADLDTLLSATEMNAVLKKQRVNTMWLTSTLYNQMITHDEYMFDELQYLLIGGEKLSEEHVRKLKERNEQIKLINGYGPTENTTFTTTYEIPSNFKRIPIGKPISNTRVYIIQDGQVCGIGVPGELCIAGDGLSRGYLNNPQLTAEKFVPCPFEDGLMYHSGDLARWLPDGNIEYIGRIDDQVKIRGFRIELGEIENAIRDVQGIKDCVVLVKIDESDDKAICAYIIADRPIVFSEFRTQLGKTLPPYMIPAYILQIEKIPTTRNGKLDKRALPEIKEERGNAYTAPRNVVEADLCKAFEEVLDLPQVGIHDNFFDLGGHSLRATKLVNQIEMNTGQKIKVKDVFTYATVAQLGSLLSTLNPSEYMQIPRAEEKEQYAMSSAQKRTYLICQIDGGRLAYNMPGFIKLEEEIDPDYICQVLQTMIDRHEIFRTEFVILNGEPVQKIRNNVKADFTYVEDLVTSEKELIDRFVKPFDLRNAPLIRMQLVKRENYNLLLIDTHHIISDGMSMDIFTREISALYNGCELKELTRQYRDYSEWMRNRDISPQRNFWLQEFPDEIPVLDIPLDFVRPQKQSYQGSSIVKRIGEELTVRIKKLAKHMRATEYMVFLSALMVLLSKYSRQKDIVIGSVISGRTHKDTAEMLGMFANTLVMRGQPEGHKLFTEFLCEINEKCLQAYENQDYPFEELVEELAIQRDLARNPLFDVMLGFQNNEKKNMDISGTSLQYSEYTSNIAKFDLTFDIREIIGQEFEIELEYCSDLFLQDTAERMVSHFVAILVQLTNNPQIQLSRVRAITKEEEKKILNMFNNTQTVYPKRKTIAQLFEEQVVKQQNKTAVVFEDKKLSYLELNQKANALARQLRDIGVNPNDCVAIMANKSIEMIVGVCGIVKSGAAYVPVDAAYPKERIRFILEDCKPNALLIFGENFSTDFPCIDIEKICTSAGEEQNLSLVNVSEDLAYIIYTSGTTGQPKGVMIEQKSVIKLVKNCDYTPLDETINILQTGQLAFDASTFEIWGSLLNGGTLYLIRDSSLLDYEQLKQYLQENNITTLFITTALFNQLIDYDETIFDSLQHLLFGGEATSELHLRKLRERHTNLDFRNVYGPTETTTFASHYMIHDAVKKTPIGKPISNTRIYIVADQELCGIGVPGELCIAGDGLSRGYLNNPQLTDEKFVSCPFEEGQMYQSGDLAKWLPDGNVEYLGRIDEQVKIRGYRIELREIESAFRAINEIKDCIVLVKDISGSKTLCAYIVAGEEMEISTIRIQLGYMLPQYMIPAYIMQIDSMPVTRNGKLDKERLPTIKIKTTVEFVAPNNEVENALCKAYREVLGLDQVGINDNFFELGGDSLKAIRIISNMRESGYSLTVQTIMQYQTISAIAAMAHASDAVVRQNEEIVFKGEVPFGMLQSLFMASDIYQRNHFNMSMMLELSESILEAAMTQAIQAVVRHHDMLRTVVQEGKQIVQGTEDLFAFEMYNLYNYEDDMIQALIQKLILKAQQTLDLQNGPVFQITVFQKKEGDLLHICVHHFVSDAVSMQILAEDLLKVYYHCKQKEPIRLPLKTASYSEWTSRFRDPDYVSFLQADATYWEKINTEVRKASLPRKSNQRKQKTMLCIGEVELPGIGILSKRIYKSDMSQLLIATVVQVVCELYQVEQIALLIESHGRQDTNLTEGLLVDRTVGWFTNVYPIVLKTQGDFKKTLSHVSKEIEKIPNSGLGYLSAMEKDNFSDIVMPDITINFLGSQDSFYHEVRGVRLSKADYGQDMHPKNIFLSPLSINVALSKDVLQSRFVYDQSVYSSKNVQNIMDRLHTLFEEQIQINQQVIFDFAERTPLHKTVQYVQEAIRAIDVYEKELILSIPFREYPLTGIQKLSYQMGARNVLVGVPFFERIDLMRFSKSWNRLLQTFDVLRSSIVIDDLQEYIRIYDWKEVQVPYLDISGLENVEKEECLQVLSAEMDCFEQEEQYRVDKLSSKVILVKVSETSSQILLACSHLIFDRFSSEVFKNKLMELYYSDYDTVTLAYQNYCSLLRNEQVTVSEDAIVECFELEKFCDRLESFFENNKKREFKTFIYHYLNREKWTQLPENEQLDVSRKLFVIAMRHIFPHMDIPLLTLHIARQNSYVNLFEYIGEFLDVVPVCIDDGKEVFIEREIQSKLAFAKENNLYFSSLLFSEGTFQYAQIRKRLSQLYEKRQYILIYNNTGILNSANDLVISSDKYVAFYNIISVVVNSDGVFINLPVDDIVENNIQAYLDEQLMHLIEEALHG